MGFFKRSAKEGWWERDGEKQNWKRPPKINPVSSRIPKMWRRIWKQRGKEQLRMKCKASCGITSSNVTSEDLVSPSSDAEHSVELAAHPRSQERSRESCWVWWGCSKGAGGWAPCWSQAGPCGLHQDLLLALGVTSGTRTKPCHRRAGMTLPLETLLHFCPVVQGTSFPKFSFPEAFWSREGWQDHRTTESQDHRITQNWDHRITELQSHSHRITQNHSHTISHTESHTITGSLRITKTQRITQKHRITESLRTTGSQDHRVTQNDKITESQDHRIIKNHRESQDHRITESQIYRITQNHTITGSHRITKSQDYRITEPLG